MAIHTVRRYGKSSGDGLEWDDTWLVSRAQRHVCQRCTTSFSRHSPRSSVSFRCGAVCLDDRTCRSCLLRHRCLLRFFRGRCKVLSVAHLPEKTKCKVIEHEGMKLWSRQDHAQLAAERLRRNHMRTKLDSFWTRCGVPLSN